MSETKAASQAARSGVEQVREATQAAVDSTARTTKEAIGRGKDMFDRTADEARNIGSAVADNTARSAGVAADMAQRSAEQSRDLMWRGMRATAGVSSQFADVNYDRSRQALKSTARALDAYRHAWESAADRLQALFVTYQQLGQGVQEMQAAAFRTFARALEQATHRPQDLLRAKSVEEFAEIQSDLFIGAVDQAFEASSTLLQMAGRIAQQATPHTQDHAKVVRP